MTVMRKCIALVLTLALLVSCGAAFAEAETAAATETAGTEFSTEIYAQYETLFTIDTDTEEDLTYIETVVTPQERAFTHKYESEYTYSCLQNDIIVIDSSKPEKIPVFRTWIYYYADKPQHFNSVTFELNGKEYTFTDISKEEWVQQTDKEYEESVLIKYGTNNLDFFAEVLIASITYAFDEDENKTAPVMKMTLHGDEEIEAEVPAGFWDDFALLGAPYTQNDYAWCAYIGQQEGTPCEIIGGEAAE